MLGVQKGIAAHAGEACNPTWGPRNCAHMRKVIEFKLKASAGAGQPLPGTRYCRLQGGKVV